MAKSFSICDLPENALLKMFDSFMKEHRDKDYDELAKMLGIPSNKMETFRQLIDDLQVHNANPSNKYHPKLPPKEKTASNKKPSPRFARSFKA